MKMLQFTLYFVARLHAALVLAKGIVKTWLGIHNRPDIDSKIQTQSQEHLKKYKFEIAFAKIDVVC